MSDVVERLGTMLGCNCRSSRAPKPGTLEAGLVQCHEPTCAFRIGQEAAADLDAAREALAWAMPLASAALEAAREVRVRAGHHDIVGTRPNGERWVGLWQNEIDAQEHARSVLARLTKGDAT